MSAWTHAVCDPCWSVLNPEREPARVAAAAAHEHGELVETCCRCGLETVSGIYLRADPVTMTHCAHREDDTA